MAVSDFSSAQKPQVYDLLSRLNASFARVFRNVALLEQAGIFDGQTITSIQRQSEKLQAEANSLLLAALQGAEKQETARPSAAE
jgi:hypothetical protein